MSLKYTKFLKLALYVVMASAMIVAVISSRCEAEILEQRQHTADVQHRYPLQVKGRNYFVTESQLQCHEIGKIVFLGEIAVVFVLILVLQRRDKAGHER